MKINTALILCAGFGKRLNPVTLDTPKPLLKIDNLTLLENTINLIKDLDIKKIKLNTFYLKDKIKSFIEEKNFNIDIEVIDDGDYILNTGGGIYNMVKSSPKTESHFLVFNPDTLWDQSYIKTINNMIEFYFLYSNSNTLLVVDKELSFDENLEGDFSLHKNKLIKTNSNNYIFTGCQIINKRIIDDSYRDKLVASFAILDTWNAAIKTKKLFGFESKNDFKHVTNLKIYKKLLND